ncbi:MAG: DUF3037 domain-containing protein [Nitrososphaerota archaeon]
MHGFYSVIRYVPYIDRDESINIGLILVSGNKVKIRFLQKMPSVKDLSYLIPDKENIKLVKSYLIERRQKLANRYYFFDVKHDLANTFQLTDLRPYSGNSDIFNDLFDMLVKPPQKHIKDLREKKSMREILYKI